MNDALDPAWAASLRDQTQAALVGMIAGPQEPPHQRRKVGTSMTILDGRRALWLHQMDQLGERNIEEVAATALTYAAANIVLVKALDGQHFMAGAGADTSPEAISGLPKLAEVTARGKAAGVDVVPWVNPLRLADAPAHAAVAAQSRVIVVDAEPYPQFWQDTPAHFAGYLQTLKQTGAEVLVSIDPRPSAVQTLGVAQWASLADGLLPQQYWTDFGVPALSTLGYVQTLRSFGVPVYPVLPYNGAAVDLMAFWLACSGLGCPSPSLWRMGTADAPQLQAFGALPVDTVVDPCGDLRAQVADLTTRLDAAQSVIAAVRQAVA